MEVVLLLLEHKPNVNAVDKDGCTALAIACRDGFHEIASALLNAGAYINIQDKSGDTNLIHAVKGGHRGIVESLLKKYADVDIPGKVSELSLKSCKNFLVPILKNFISLITSGQKNSHVHSGRKGQCFDFESPAGGES